MKRPNIAYNRFARLLRRIGYAERIANIGMALMILATLLRTAQAVPMSRSQLFVEWAVCAATVFGWALLAVGMRLTTQAITMDIARDASARRTTQPRELAQRTTAKIERGTQKTPAGTRRIVQETQGARRITHDDPTLHRAVRAMFANSDVR